MVLFHNCLVVQQLTTKTLQERVYFIVDSVKSTLVPQSCNNQHSEVFIQNNKDDHWCIILSVRSTREVVVYIEYSEYTNQFTTFTHINYYY